jgi:hypothetical protein
MELVLSQKPSNPRTLVEFISSLAARQGFSGCVLYGESLAGKAFPYPYTYAVAVHNPFIGALKSRQLEIVRVDQHKGGPVEMRKQVKEPLWPWHDLDFKSMEDRTTPDILLEIANQAEQAGNDNEALKRRQEAEEPYLSLQDMASASRSRTTGLFEEIKARLELFCSFTVGAPSLKGFLEQTVPVLIDHVSYFGLMQEAVYQRLQWEVLAAEEGDGPIIGDLGGDPVHAIGSPDFFFQFMELMNFEHDCQTDYEIKQIKPD